MSQCGEFEVIRLGGGFCCRFRKNKLVKCESVDCLHMINTHLR